VETEGCQQNAVEVGDKTVSCVAFAEFQSFPAHKVIKFTI
jgi:hypothetical protein